MDSQAGERVRQARAQGAGTGQAGPAERAGAEGRGRIGLAGPEWGQIREGEGRPLDL